MAYRRIEANKLLELVRLHRLGLSARETTRLLGMGPNTERRYREALGSAGLLQGQPDALPSSEVVREAVTAALPPRPGHRPSSSVEPWRARVEALVEKGLSPQAVFDRLRISTREEGVPFRASYTAVKRFCRQFRRERGDAEHVAIPVDSAPGECCQVDFGYAGKLYDPALGVQRRAWVFIMLACFSRVLFVRLVFDQRIETWLQLHVQGFAELGGVFATVRPDHTRRAVVRAAFGIDGDCELNRSYRELARHHGFVIDPAPPGQPWKKGKVEAAVRYLRGGPLKARDGEPIDLVQAELLRWNEEVASVRIHGTTKQRPGEVFDGVERAALRPLPASPFDLPVWKRARVHPDSHVAYRERLYSIPWRLVGEEVWLRATAARVEAFHDDQRVAVHPRTGPWRSTLEEHLPANRAELRHRGRALWEERAGRIGIETVALVREVFDQDPALSSLRRVQAIVRYLDQYPRNRAEAASRHVRTKGKLTYREVREYLTSGLDLVPQQVGVLD